MYCAHNVYTNENFQFYFKRNKLSGIDIASHLFYSRISFHGKFENKHR